MYQATYTQNLELVKLLIDEGADINALNHFSTSALGAAIQIGHNEIAALLLKYGADVTQLHLGEPILCTAVEKITNIDIIKTLLEKGADINFKSNFATCSFFEFSPLFIAVDQGVLLGNHYTIGIRC